MSNNKTKKPISHFNRLNSQKTFMCKPKELEETYVYRQVMEKSEYTGTLVPVIKKVVFDSPQRKYKASDFALQNLISLGVKLPETKLSMSTAGKITNITEQINTITSTNE